MKRILFVLTICLGASACVYTHIEAKPQTVAGAFHVNTPVEWNQRDQEKMTVWTIDGQGLQLLGFVNGIDDGQVLYPGGKPDILEKLPKFDKKMSLPEIRELLLNSIEAASLEDVREEKFEPAKFGGEDGFRLQYRAASKQGLEYRGMLVGAVRNGKLWFVQYAGTDLYYYEKALPAVEEILNSLKFI